MSEQLLFVSNQELRRAKVGIKNVATDDATSWQTYRWFKIILALALSFLVVTFFSLNMNGKGGTSCILSYSIQCCHSNFNHCLPHFVQRHHRVSLHVVSFWSICSNKCRFDIDYFFKMPIGETDVDFNFNWKSCTMIFLKTSWIAKFQWLLGCNKIISWINFPLKIYTFFCMIWYMYM